MCILHYQVRKCDMAVILQVMNLELQGFKNTNNANIRDNKLTVKSIQ